MSDGESPNSTVQDPLAIPKTYSHDMGISPNNNIKEFLDFLSPYGNKKGLISPACLQDLLSQLGNISRKPAALKVLLNLIEIKAATVHVLHLRLNLPTTSLYRALEFLGTKGLVVKTLPLSTKGRPTTIYALCDHTPDDVSEAIQQDRITRTSGYTEVQRITQLILDDYLPLLRSKGYKEIYTAEVMAVIKSTQRGFRSRDLYNPVIENLSERGVSIVSCPTMRIP